MGQEPDQREKQNVCKEAFWSSWTKVSVLSKWNLSVAPTGTVYVDCEGCACLALLCTTMLHFFGLWDSEYKICIGDQADERYLLDFVSHVHMGKIGDI
jgi:hypothetical protein